MLFDVFSNNRFSLRKFFFFDKIIESIFYEINLYLFGSGKSSDDEDYVDESNIKCIRYASGKIITCINYYNENNIIASTIALHRNELFDWIFEKKIVNKRKKCDNLEQIAYISASSGNAHSLIQIIDNGFNISESQNIVHCAAENGFCELTKLLLSIID